MGTVTYETIPRARFSRTKSDQRPALAFRKNQSEPALSACAFQLYCEERFPPQRIVVNPSSRARAGATPDAPKMYGLIGCVGRPASTRTPTTSAPPGASAATPDGAWPAKAPIRASGAIHLR